MGGYFFEFKLDECVGCHACQVACQVFNGQQENGTWRQIFYPANTNTEIIPLSMACNHCNDAPCLKQCPSRAIWRDSETGAVLIDEKKCIGCGYCIWNCPYEAPVFNKKTGVMGKCHFCNDRLHHNLEPACVSLCPTNALRLGNSEYENSNPLKSITGMPRPRMKIDRHNLNQKMNPKPIQFDLEQAGIKTNYSPVESGNKRSLKSILFSEEWPLYIFTLVISVLAAITTVRIPELSHFTSLLILLLTGGLAASFSLFHLGKPGRAWRAISNVRTSWLSREIMFLGLFLFGLVADLVVGFPAYIHLLTAVPLILSIDMIYRPVQWHWSLPIGSGQSWMIFISTLLLAHEQIGAFIIVAGLRLFLFLFQQAWSKGIIIPVLRVLSLLVSSFLILLGNSWLIVLPVFLLGEGLDRFKFYGNLKIQDVSTGYSLWLGK